MNLMRRTFFNMMNNMRWHMILMIYVWMTFELSQCTADDLLATVLLANISIFKPCGNTGYECNAILAYCSNEHTGECDICDCNRPHRLCIEGCKVQANDDAMAQLRSKYSKAVLEQTRTENTLALYKIAAWPAFTVIILIVLLTIVAVCKKDQIKAKVRKWACAKNASTPKDQSMEPLMPDNHNNNPDGGELSDVESPKSDDNVNAGRATIGNTSTVPPQPERPQSLSTPPTAPPHNSEKTTKPKQDYPVSLHVTDEVLRKEDKELTNNGVEPIAYEAENKADVSQGGKHMSPDSQRDVESAFVPSVTTNDNSKKLVL